MFAPLDLKEFYSQTLKQAGFTPPEDQIEKFAASNQIDVETAKMASAIFEQLQLDGVKYDSQQDMFQDALKIAHAYADHVKEASAQAEKIAGDLHRVARHAIEGYLAQHGIKLDADEGVKIAGLQATSFQKLMQKQAALHQPEDEAKTAGGGARYNPLPGGGTGTYDPSATAIHLATLAGSDLTNAAQHAQYAGAVHSVLNAYPEEHRSTIADQIAHGMETNGLNFAQSHQRAHANFTAPPKSPGLMGRPGVLLGAGALGLGALYMMKKRREEAAQRQGAIMGAASMPAA